MSVETKAGAAKIKILGTILANLFKLKSCLCYPFIYAYQPLLAEVPPRDEQ